MTTLTAPVTPEQILRRATELAPGFRARTPLTESQRRVPRESVDELLDAGLARMLVPTEYGGLETSVRATVDTVMAVAHGCASTGWISWLMMHVPHVIAAFPGEAQATVWAEGPDVVACGSHTGMTAELVPGGYRISGRGAFTSGVDNAEWVYVGGLAPSPDGPPRLLYFLVPRKDFTIDDTWDTIGMRGTGSNTVVCDDVFVAESFTLDHVAAREGTGPGVALHSDNASLRLPWVATGALGFIATMVGATQGAYDDVTAKLATKRTPGGARAADSQALQIEVGLISAKIDAARVLLRDLAARADAGGTFTLATRARMTRTGAYIASLALEAVDGVMALSGTSGFAPTAVAQQAWRDVHFAAAHQGLDRRATWGRYGRSVLGVEETNPGIFY